MKKKISKKSTIDVSSLTKDQLRYLKSLVRDGDTENCITEVEGKAIIGGILKRLRGLAGKTQAEIAASLGYDNPQFVSNIERGVAAIPVGMIGRFVTACGIEDDMFHPAVLYLCHPAVWRDVLQMVEIAGSDSPAFEQRVKQWVLENR